jgi:hypothetical protein
VFIAPLKTLLTEAVLMTFDGDYPTADFRNIKASIEYPEKKQDYPSIWVDFDPTGELEIVGVAHYELTEPDEDGNRHSYTRWRFQGYATYTVVAMTSLERDRLFDEVIKVMAFGKEQAATSEFRTYIEDNEFIAVNFDFDQIGIRGFTATPGTPWGTDEVIYEATVAMECVGEFVSDGSTQALAPLSAIQVTAYASNQPDPFSPADEGGWK